MEKKERLRDLALQQTDAQIAEIKKALSSVIEARNNETKSSVGDKFETGRAMLQNEERNIRTQLGKTKLTRALLAEIDVGRQMKRVAQGALVRCSTGSYFISVGIGKLLLDDDLYYAISLESPIGRRLMGKEAGDWIIFNKQRIQLLEVC